MSRPRSRAITPIDVPLAALPTVAKASYSIVTYGGQSVNLERFAFDAGANARKLPYVEWGSDNLYPSFIVELLKISPIFNRVSTSFVNMAVGDGLSVDGDQGVKDSAISYLADLGVNDYMLNQLAWDAVVLNVTSMMVTTSDIASTVDGSATFDVISVNHVRAEQVRVGQPLAVLVDTEEGTVKARAQGVLYTALDWRQVDGQWQNRAKHI
jgi:hypothetical protein